MRRLLPLLMTVALAGASAGCGGSAVPARTWVASVCQTLGPWRDTIAGLNRQAQQQMALAADPQQTRTNLLGLLDGAGGATRAARARLARAGVPDVDGGAAIAKQFLASLDAVAEAYARAERSVGDLSTDDAIRFYDGVASALTTLNQEYATAGLDASGLSSAELRRDFDEVAACR